MMVEAAPAIWILTGRREGDNAQVRELAEATGLDFAEKKLFYNRFYKLPNSIKGSGLWTVLPHARKLLQPPWPRVVIGIGRRSVPVMRWIKQQSQGAAHLVHVGRPRLSAAFFDLILTTPQYRLPARANILSMPLPLSRLRRADLKSEARTWRHITEGLKRPFTSLLVGGDTDAYRLGAAAAAKLGRLASAHAHARAGSLLVTTSPRTTREAELALVNALTVPAHVYRWSDAGGENNPYLGLLALADDIIVTSDSASLMSDAVVTDKKIWFFDTPTAEYQFVKSRLHKWFSAIERYEQARVRPAMPLHMLRALANRGMVSPPRHMPRLFEVLEGEKLVRRLGEDDADAGATSVLKARCEAVLKEAVERVVALD